MRLPYSPTPRYSPEATPHPLLTIHQHRTLFLQLLMPPQHLPVGARKVHQQNSFSFLVANSPPRKKKWATLQTVFPPRLTSPTPPNNHRNHQEIRATPKTTNHVCQPPIHEHEANVWPDPDETWTAATATVLVRGLQCVDLPSYGHCCSVDRSSLENLDKFLIFNWWLSREPLGSCPITKLSLVFLCGEEIAELERGCWTTSQRNLYPIGDLRTDCAIGVPLLNSWANTERGGVLVQWTPSINSGD